ncbi:MAG TPA: peptidase T [Solirubrobacteraceae bacterium]|nr:peptidase T [Solirubrobacteraceae bacterium]
MPDPLFTSELAAALAPGLLERFDRYVRVDTQAVRERTHSPSSTGQIELGRVLVQDLHAAGLRDAAQDEHGYVFATLPATVPDAPVIGLIAHMDVSPDAPAAGVEPIVHRDYPGGVIELPRGGTRLDPVSMPALSAKHGHDIVTSSGDTLLGADDKAGVAEIVTAVAHLAAHPELPRPTLRVAFTPDEEIGQGASLFDIPAFGASCAYTLDGSEIGELQDESFSAVEVRIAVRGVDVHPGTAYGKLVNALRVVAGIVAALPADRLSPETTSGREGFLHPHLIEGDAARAELRVIARDFDDDLLRAHVALLRVITDEALAAFPGARAEFDVREQYRNMKSFIAPEPRIVAAAEQALRAEGIEPVRTAIRGGTDGSLLSEMGLPTPNLFTGGHEYHSVREWASLNDMAAAAATVVRLAGVWAASGGTGSAAASRSAAAGDTGSAAA